MHTFKIGDWVYAGPDQWCYGQIVVFDGQEKDIAVVEYDTGTGGGSMGFDLDDLELAEPHGGISVAIKIGRTESPFGIVTSIADGFVR